VNRLRLGAALLLAAVGLIATPGVAFAHPLGNFTTNQYFGLRVSPDGVDVDYVLDLAELPAYQATLEMGSAAGGAGHDAYAARTCAAVAQATTVTVDRRTATVTGTPIGLTFPPGAGGLTTLRLQCLLHAPAHPADGTTIGFSADYLADRIGWREVTAVGDRCTVTGSSVPTTSVSARLTAYPPDAPTSDVRAAQLTVRPGGPAAAPFPGEPGAGATHGTDRLTRWFTDLVGHPRLTWGVGILAFLVAFILGGAHAVAPGHGKTIMAAYLIGTRGRLTHALWVAITVAITHTAGVLALGVVLATSLELAPRDLYEWLRLASGILIAGVGAQLLRQALRTARARRAAEHPSHDHHEHAGHAHAGHAHSGHAEAVHLHAERDHIHGELVHAHGGHQHAPHGSDTSHDLNHAGDHDHGHSHDGHSHDGHAHDHRADVGHSHDYAVVRGGEPHSHGGGRPHTHHLPSPDEPFRVRTLLAMGFAGGLSPSPSAVVVLLGAAALGRAWYGVVLVLAYGIGLAAVLTGIGFALAHWGERLRTIGSGRFAGLFQRRMPTVTASAILAVGMGMATLAVMSLLTTA
jgi:nickel/cobalt exporter